MTRSFQGLGSGFTVVFMAKTEPRNHVAEEPAAPLARVGPVFPSILRSGTSLGE